MSALAPSSKITQLNLALHSLCLHLQLPEDLFNTAREKYTEVGQWLIKPGSPVRQGLPSN